MSRQRKLTAEQEVELVKMSRKGYSNKEIAKFFGISTVTVRTYYNRAIKERKLINNRRTILSNANRSLYYDTSALKYIGVYTPEGHETIECEIMHAINDDDAIKKFEEWIQEEDDALAYVLECEEEVEDDETPDQPSSDSEFAEPWNSTSLTVPKVLYVIYVDGGRPKNYFYDMDQACRVVDQLNSALEFAGVDQRYQVEEVEYWDN